MASITVSSWSCLISDGTKGQISLKQKDQHCWKTWTISDVRWRWTSLKDLHTISFCNVWSLFSCSTKHSGNTDVSSCCYETTDGQNEVENTSEWVSELKGCSMFKNDSVCSVFFFLSKSQFISYSLQLKHWCFTKTWLFASVTPWGSCWLCLNDRFVFRDSFIHFLQQCVWDQCVCSW